MVWVVNPDTGDIEQIDKPSSDAEAQEYLPHTDQASRAYQDCRESGMSPWDALNQGTRYAGSSDDDGEWEDNAW